MAHDPPEQEPRPEESQPEHPPESAPPPPAEEPPGPYPEQAAPQQAYPEQAHPQQSDPQQGYPSQPDPQQAAQEQAYPQQAQPPGTHPAPGVYDELSSPAPDEAQAQQESAPLPAPPPPVSQVPPAGNVSPEPQAGAPPRRSVGQARVRAGRGVPARPRRQPAPASVDVGGIFMNLFLGIVGLALLGVVAVVVLPKDLSAVKGYPADPLATEAPKNLLPDLQGILFKPGGEVSFTEKEINDFLNHRVQGDQGGLFGSFLKFQGLYVDFTSGMMEVHVERALFGFPVTISTRIRVDQFQGQTRWIPSGGAIGKFDLPNKQLQPVVQAYQRMMMAAKDEVQAVRKMALVRFDEDSVTFVR